MLKKIGKYSLYALFTNAIFGAIVYFTHTWLSRHSLLPAYLGNLVLIVLGLVIDEYALKVIQSEKFVDQIKESGDIEKNYRMIRLYFDGFISFKTLLYLFYVVIMILSQIIVFYPALLNEGLMSFINANQYSILLLIAIDQIIGQFAKDRERIRIISEKMKEDLSENQND